MPHINEREAALYALIDITRSGGYNNLVLKRTLARLNAADAAQKAFVTDAVNGVLRHMTYIDYALDTFSKTPTSKMKPFILNNLRLAAYQLLFMDKVPDYAALSEAVKLCKAKGFQSLAPFTNGVLRSLAANKDTIAPPNRETDVSAFLSVRYSAAPWLVDYWLSFLGAESVEAMLQAGNSRPSVSVCVNTLKTNKSALIASLESEGVVCTPCKTSEQGLFLAKTSDLSALKAFQDGCFHVMDPGAMLAVSALSPPPESTGLDMCAAPGGKSFLAAMFMKNTGKLVSADIHPHKLSLMEEGASRLGITNMKPVCADSSAFGADYTEAFDWVLLDAPCSGFGLLRKKPDIKYTKTMDDVNNLAALQRKLLEKAAAYVKPGGVLLYCTCTISRAENEDNTAWFLKNFPFKTENLPLGTSTLPPAVLKCADGANESGALSLLPGAYEGDGFYVARFRKQDALKERIHKY